MNSLAQALRELGSRNQKAREAAARALLREAGEPGTVASVLHHRDGGYYPAVLAALAADDSYAKQAASYLGAWHGTVTQAPRVVAFHAHPDGADRLHVVRAQVQPEELASALRGAGVGSFSLRPGTGATTGFVYDRGGLYDFTHIAARLPGGSSNFTPGTGERLGEGSGTDADAADRGPVAAYRDHIRRHEAAVAGASDGVPAAGVMKLARLPRGAMRHADLKTWRAVIAKMPEDRVRRGALADWLEERGHHHDDLTLHLLREHEGPVFLARHPRTKKAVAVAGHPVTDDGTFMALLHQRRGGAQPVQFAYRPTEEFHHGPRGITRISRVRDGRDGVVTHGFIVESYGSDARLLATPYRFAHTIPDARRIAQEHAFGV